VYQHVLEKPKADDTEDFNVSHTIAATNLAMVDPADVDLESEESAVVDFVIRLSDMLDYTTHDVTPSMTPLSSSANPGVRRRTYAGR